MKLIVGLGNPGRKYVGTRHNVGFNVLAEVAQRFGTGRVRERFQGETIEADIHGNRVLLLCPQTFMNNSGRSVVAARDFYKLDNDAVLIVCDDFNLPLAKLRFRPKGSAGGQKGLDDIIRCVGDDEITRLRFGVGTLPEGWDAAGYVLSKFTKDERDTVDCCVRRAADGVVDWVTQGTDFCMNQYNSD